MTRRAYNRPRIAGDDPARAERIAAAAREYLAACARENVTLRGALEAAAYCATGTVMRLAAFAREHARDA